jgi:transposase
VRFIGLDVHKDFCEVAVVEGDACWSGPRVRSTPEDLEVFGQSLGPKDHVVLEATGGALAIARILECYAGRVVMANPMAVRAIASAKAKTDRLDARTLARLLAAGFLPEVWMGDERTRLLRRLVSRHAQLIRQRTRAKNQIHAVLQRTLKGRPPMTDLFGRRGRAWLDVQDLPADERDTVQAGLRHVDFLDGELRLVDRTIAEQVLAWPEVRRIMTIPGDGRHGCGGSDGHHRGHPTVPHASPLGGLPRAGCPGPAVGIGPSPAWRHLQAGLLGGQAPPGRGGVGGRQDTRTAPGVRGKDPLPSRGQHRHGGRGPQARRAQLASAHLGGGLRIRPALPCPAEGPAPRAGRRRRPPDRLPEPGPRLRHASPAPAGAGSRSQAEKAYRRLVKDFKVTGKKGAGAATGARISSARKGQAARQGQAPNPAL